MSQRLDPAEQRIVGVLIEKEATVPDTYPLSENALIDGCNQKSNREPVLDLVAFQVAGALMALCEKGWVARVDGGGRVTKFRHKVVERLGLTKAELAVFCELLVRGPQAPGALKPRVARMGFVGEAADVEGVLQRLASRPQPLVEQLPLAPRERDRRWRHLVGDGTEAAGPAPAAAPIRTPEPIGIAAQPSAAAQPGAPQPAAPQSAVPLPPPVPQQPAAAPAGPSLEARVAALEAEVAALRAIVSRHGGTR